MGVRLALVIGRDGPRRDTVLSCHAQCPRRAGPGFVCVFVRQRPWRRLWCSRRVLWRLWVSPRRLRRGSPRCRPPGLGRPRGQNHRRAFPRIDYPRMRRHSTPSGPRIPHLDPSLQRPGRPASELVHVRIRGVAAQAVDAVRHAGGRVLARVPGEVSATVPRSALTALAGSAGVSDVAPAVEAVPDVVSESVAKSGASTWLNATPATTGAGVTVAIVDTGFGNLSAEVAAGALPAGTTVSPLNNGCSNVKTPSMAPQSPRSSTRWRPARSCNSTASAIRHRFRQAEQDIVSRGIPIVNSSLSFPGDSRGDGSGDADISGRDRPGRPQGRGARIASLATMVRITGAGRSPIVIAMVIPTSTGRRRPTSQTRWWSHLGRAESAYLTWDQWPQSSAPVTLVATPYKCDPSGCQSSTWL